MLFDTVVFFIAPLIHYFLQENKGVNNNNNKKSVWWSGVESCGGHDSFHQLRLFLVCLRLVFNYYVLDSSL